VSPCKILILGGTGMLGHKLFQQLRARFSGTRCTIRSSAGAAPYSRIPLLQNRDVIEGVDAFHFEKLAKLLLRLEPQFLINCIGITNQGQNASHCSRISWLSSALSGVGV
jgi:dTDP-4-dehydrorhamnose reductase